MFKEYTKELLHKLIDTEDKIEFDFIIENEFNSCTDYFTTKEYEIDKEKGFVGRQILDDNDLFIYQYYRDLHFIYWGLKSNWKTFDLLDKVYYDNLRRMIEGIYNSKK